MHLIEQYGTTWFKQRSSFKALKTLSALLLLNSGLCHEISICWAASAETTTATDLSTAQSLSKSTGQVAEAETKPSSAQAAEAWRKSAPSLPQPRPFVMPNVVSYKLSNGLDVQLVEDHRVPFITVELGFKTGSTADGGKFGLSAITADMITEGTKTKKSKEIAEAVDFIGGSLSASSDFDNTLVSMSGLSKYSDRVFSILSDVVLNPSFPEDELKLKKSNIIAELAMKRSEPDFLLDERFNKVTFGEHPYAIVAPTKESIESVSRQDLIDFHSHYYLPNKAHLVVIGDFNADKMKQTIANAFESNWQPGKPPMVPQRGMPEQHGRKIYLVDRPGSVQSSIKVGNLSLSKTDPDYFPMLVANQILGGAGNSRLFLNIRENKGYTYGAYSHVGARKQKGAFEAETEVRTDVTAPSLQEVLYELDRLRNVKVSGKELGEAKSYLAGAFQLGLETQNGLASRLLERRLYELPDNYLETYVTNVLAVSLDDVRRVARKHIDLDNVVICVVGDASKIKPDLEMFAAVDVYDTSGKLSSSEKSLSQPGS
jgi:predicted Zn-dependent peptidase